MSDKCNMCKCYVEDGNCPCHFVNDDELCDFSFELINIAEHDKQTKSDSIHEFISWLQETHKIDLHIWETLDDYACEYCEYLKGNKE